MLVEWLLLLLLVPAILVPLALLGGFAGCVFEHGTVHAQPSAPTSVTAVGVSGSEILVSWTNPNMFPVTFDVERDPAAPGPVVVHTGQPASPFRDNTGLDTWGTYFYRARAVADGVPSAAWSTPPAEASASARAFEANFNQNPPLAGNQAGLEGWCLVQRIEPARLLASGTSVRITVRAPTTGELRLTKITISEAAAIGELFDAAAPPTVVDSSVWVPKGEAHTTPPVAYTLERTRPQLVAFEIGGDAGNVRYVQVPQAEASMYFKAGTAMAPVAEAEVVNRSGYTLSVPPGSPPGTSTIYLVETIDVA